MPGQEAVVGTTGRAEHGGWVISPVVLVVKMSEKQGKRSGRFSLPLNSGRLMAEMLFHIT